MAEGQHGDSSGALVTGNKAEGTRLRPPRTPGTQEPRAGGGRERLLDGKGQARGGRGRGHRPHGPLHSAVLGTAGLHGPCPLTRLSSLRSPGPPSFPAPPARTQDVSPSPGVRRDVWAGVTEGSAAPLIARGSPLFSPRCPPMLRWGQAGVCRGPGDRLAWGLGWAHPHGGHTRRPPLCCVSELAARVMAALAGHRQPRAGPAREGRAGLEATRTDPKHPSPVRDTRMLGQGSGSAAHCGRA